MKKIFIISPVRNLNRSTFYLLEGYIAELENEGHKVHLPHRDTDQEASGFDICLQNSQAIACADEVHVLYDPDSKGSHFDLGVAFSLKKPIRLVNGYVDGENVNKKTFLGMISDWENNPFEITRDEQVLYQYLTHLSNHDQIETGREELYKAVGEYIEEREVNGCRGLGCKDTAYV